MLDSDLAGFRFVKTGAPLSADTYTLTLRSETNGFIDTLGQRLDGDDDGSAGGNYVETFSIAAGGALLSIPDIARGPGQPVSQPAIASGLPVTLSNAVGANRVDFTLEYDSALLAVTGVTLGAGAPAGSTLTTDISQAGRVVVAVNLGATITTAAARELVRIQSAVPLSAAGLYAQKQVLDLKGVSINQGALAVRADDGVHVNAYVGDANANRGYNTLDVEQLQRVVVKFDTGFAAYPLLDPAILGDTSGNAVFNTLDVMRLQQVVMGVPQSAIPPLPVPALPLQIFSGADPVVHVGTVGATPGATVSVVSAAVATPEVTKEMPAEPVAPQAVAAVQHDAGGIVGPVLDTPVPVPQRLSPAAMMRQSEATAAVVVPPVEPVSGAVRIASAVVSTAPRALPDFYFEQPAWLKTFAGAVDPAPAVNPNAGLRVAVPAAAKVTSALNLLPRH